MRTIGRHFPAGRRQGEMEAICEICGVAWLRSQLREDSVGRLVCPDEGYGLDEVELAEADAAAMASVDLDVHQTRPGIPPSEGQPFYVSPMSIVGKARTALWLVPDSGLRVTAQDASWTSQKPEARPTRLVKVGSLPSVSGGGLLFDNNGRPGLKSPHGAVRLPPGSEPTLWVVANLAATQSAAAQIMLLVGDEDDLTKAWAGLYRSRLDVSSGVVTFGSVLVDGGVFFAANASRPTDAVHLYYGKLTQSLLTLGIDDAETTAAGPSLPTSGFKQVSVGDDGAGTLYEAFVTTDQMTAQEEASLKAYFRRRYPDLP